MKIVRVKLTIEAESTYLKIQREAKTSKLSQSLLNGINHKKELLKKTRLGGRVILLQMPPRGKNAIYTLKETHLANMIFSNERYNPQNISGVSINGIIAVTFGESSASDDELREICDIKITRKRTPLELALIHAEGSRTKRKMAYFAVDITEEEAAKLYGF